MLPIGGHPFLEYLIWQLSGSGIAKIVISSGYRGDVIRSYFGDGERWGVEIRYSHEATPLGTGGAVRLAATLLEDERFLLLNGDSVCDVDLPALLDAAGAGLLGAMTLTNVPDGGRYGTVALAPGGLIRAFRQNDPTGGPALVNAGVYALRRELVDLIPAGASSLERDVLPPLGGRIRAVVSDGYFIDIGLPETYQRVSVDPRPLLRAVRRSDHLG